MRRFPILFTVLALSAFAGCSSEKDDSLQEDIQTVQDQSVVLGEYVVEFDDATSGEIEDAGGALQTKSSEVARVFEELGVVSLERVFPDAGKWEARHREAGLHRFYKVKFDKSVSLTKAGDEFLSLPGAVSAEPVRKIKPASSSVFNDPYLADQWSYDNDGSGGVAYFKAGIDVNVAPVWKNYTGGRKDVIVAVLDQGVDMSHPDLAAVCIPGGTSGSKNFVEGHSGYIIVGGDHGTHVAGTIAAINNNGIGCCGVAGGLDGNGGVSILSCQIMMTDPYDSEKTLQGDGAEAMVWAADHGAVISQNSWSYVDADGLGSAMASAIDYFVAYAGLDEQGAQTGPMKGGVVFFAAGNEANDKSWPGMYEKVTAVGAINSLGEIAYYSNYGDWVDICAPGGDAKVGPMILSCTTNEGYGEMQGTSMACPHVSGVAALIVSHFGGPGFTNEMLLERLYGGANGNVSCAGRIGPLVDALGAFTYGGTTPPSKVTDFSISQKLNSATLTWKAVADPDDGVAHHYLLLASKDRNALESYSKANPDASVKAVSVENGDAAVGDELSGDIASLEFESDYYIAIIASDYAGNYSEMSPVKTMRTPVNNPPVITCLDDIAMPVIVRSHEKITLSLSIQDPDDHLFTVNFEPGSDAATIIPKSANDYELTLVGKKAPAGDYAVVFDVTDEYGATANLTIPYTIMENHPPKLVRNVDNILLNGPGESVSLVLSDYISDEDGETLTVKSTSTSSNIATAYSKGDALVVEALGYGVTDITVTASDAVGKSCSTTFKVAVRDPSVPVLLYPNPVSTVLNVSTADDTTAEIRIVSKAGATVREVKQSVSPFEPAVFDMNDCPAGVYSVVFKGGSIDERYTIVKK